MKKGATRISWENMAAFRLSKHHLSERAPASALTSVLADMGGAQSQVLLAAQMSIWARVEDLPIGDLETAINEDRILARAWCMRRTMSLLPSDSLPVFIRASARRAEREIRLVLSRSVSQTVLDELQTRC